MKLESPPENLAYSCVWTWKFHFSDSDFFFYLAWRNVPSFDQQCFFSEHRSLDPLYIYSPFDLTVKMLKNDTTNPEAFKQFYLQLISDYTLRQRKVSLTAQRPLKRSQRRLFPPSVFVNHTLAVSPRWQFCILWGTTSYPFGCRACLPFSGEVFPDPVWFPSISPSYI